MRDRKRKDDRCNKKLLINQFFNSFSFLLLHPSIGFVIGPRQGFCANVFHFPNEKLISEFLYRQLGISWMQIRALMRGGVYNINFFLEHFDHSLFHVVFSSRGIFSGIRDMCPQFFVKYQVHCLDFQLILGFFGHSTMFMYRVRSCNIL